MRPAEGAGASWTTADRNRHAASWGPTLGRRRLPAHRNARGFTIIELLVTVVGQSEIGSDGSLNCVSRELLHDKRNDVGAQGR